MGLLSELETLTPSELLNALAIRIYEPPLSEVRDRLNEIPDPLRIPILFIDFDAEVCINGMLGFLENSTGQFFTETIDAFEKIGASETASILSAIDQTLKKHGVTPASLRADFVGTQEHQITSFEELHGDLGTLREEVMQDALRLYLYDDSAAVEPVWSLLEAYVARHRPELIVEIDRAAPEWPATEPFRVLS